MGKIIKHRISYSSSGTDGKSAYQTWLDLGNEGTEQDFIDSLGGGGANSLIITGNYSIDDEGNWVVSNIDKTFAEIDEAITNNQDVVLKIYPEGDTTNPYILHPAMHYANMGTAFSLAVCDEGQISGLSVMITADNQVVASRNEYDFEEFYNKTEADEKFASKEDLNTMSATEQILTSTLGYTCKNLIPSPYGTNPSESRGVTFTPNADGSINYNGIANDPTAPFYTYPTVMYLPAGSYKVTGGDDIYGGAGVLLYDDKDCTVTYTGRHEGLLTISTTSVYIFNTLDGTVNWNKDTNPYGYEKEFTIDKPAYAKVQARGVNNTYTEEVSGIIYPMVRLASIENTTWEEYKPNIDERFNTFLGGKEIKALNNQFGSVTKLFRVTSAPTESGKCYTVKFVAQRKNATAHTEYLTVSRINDSYTFESSIELQEKNVSTGSSVTMENANFLIVDANYELWAHIPSYTYAYVELISPNAKGTFVIDGSEGEIAEDAVLETFSKRETDAFAKKGEIEALKKSVSDGKSAVAGAITAKGIDTAADAEFATIEENIRKIDTENPILVVKQSNITDKIFGSNIISGNGVYVAYSEKTLYYSKDDGVTWTACSLNTSSATSCSLVFAKKHNLFLAMLNGLGVYVSLDGVTWEQKVNASSANYFYYDETTGICLAGNGSGTGAGIYYSVNGYSWNVNGSYTGRKISGFYGGGGYVYAHIDGVAYSSPDGYNWSIISSISGKTINDLEYNGGLWMISINANTPSDSWYYSTNGSTFTKSTVAFTDTTYGTAFQGGMQRINATTWIVAMYTGIWYTTDKGKNWASSNLGIKSGNWQLFSFKGKIYAASAGGPGSTYGGLYYTTDGKTWTATTGITDGANGASTSGKVFYSRGKCFISCNNNSSIRGIYSLNSNGTSWTKVLANDHLMYADNNIFITNGGKYSTDGVTWKLPDKSGAQNVDFTVSNAYCNGNSLVIATSKAADGMLYARLIY